MAGNVVSNVKKYYGGQVPVPSQGDSDGKVKVLVEKTATIEIGGVQTEVELLYDADDLTTPVTPQQLGQWTDENYLIAFKKREADGRVRGFVLYALKTDSTSTDTLVNRAEFIAFKEDMAHEPGASAYEFTMVEDSSTLARYLRDENGEMVVKFNQATVEAGAQSGTLHELIDTDSSVLYFEVVHEDGKSYLWLNTEGLGGILDDIDADIQYILGALDELPSDEHGYFNSSLYTTPGDGTTTNLVMDDFRIMQDRDVSGENIEFVPTHQEGGVDFGNVYLEPGTYIFTVHYTLQWVGYPRGTFLPLVTNVGDRPFDFSYEHEDVVRTTRIVTRTTRGKFSLSFPFDADTPSMGIWVKNLEIAQIASYNHAAVAHDTTLTGTGKLDNPLGVTPAAFGKVKDIPTSISQFRTGDVIPVDGPNGPAKMPASDLQDVIIGGPIGEAVQDWLDEHPEATTTVEDGSLTEAKFSDALKSQTIKDYVTPEMFGAVGDGVTDDTTAIQNALAAISSGGTLVLLCKTYLISSTLHIEKNVKVSGVSPCGSILKTNTDITVLELSDFLGVSGIVLSNFKIDGPGRVNSTTYGVYLNKTNYAILRNMTVNNFSVGIQLNKAIDNVIDHCFVGYCNDGIYGTNGSYNNRIFSGTIGGCEHDGISGTWDFKVSCYGLDIEHCKHCAIGGNPHFTGYALHIEGSATSIAVRVAASCRIILKDCYLGKFATAFKQEVDAVENGVLIVENITLTDCACDFDAPKFFGYTISQYYTLNNLGGERSPVINLSQYGGIIGRKKYIGYQQYHWEMTYGGIITNRLQATSIYEGSLRVVKTVYSGSLTFTASNISANSTTTVDIPMPAGTPALNTDYDSVIVNEVSFDNDILLKARVKDSATVQISVRNVSNSTITLSNRSIHVHVIR